MSHHPAAVILGIAYDLPPEQVECLSAAFDDADEAGMTAWPESLWWLEDLVRENALHHTVPDVVLSAVEDEWIGSPGFSALVEKLTRFGLLREGTLNAILRAMGER